MKDENLNNQQASNSDLGAVSGSLHPDSENLLKKCFAELREKMIRNEEKYGYSNEWLKHDWEEECRNELRRHLDKGDPKDVAIYAMFMMYRGWSSNDR